MQTESSVEIDRPIDEVFDYTTSHVSEWSPTVVEDEVIDSKPGVVGSTFRVVTGEGNRRMEFSGVVTRHEPPRAHAVLMKGKQFDIEADYRFEDLGGRTRVTERATVQGKGFVKAMFSLFGWLIRRSSCKALDLELANLKKTCEARAGQAAS